MLGEVAISCRKCFFGCDRKFNFYSFPEEKKATVIIVCFLGHRQPYYICLWHFPEHFFLTCPVLLNFPSKLLLCFLQYHCIQSHYTTYSRSDTGSNMCGWISEVDISNDTQVKLHEIVKSWFVCVASAAFGGTGWCSVLKCFSHTSSHQHEGRQELK